MKNILWISSVLLLFVSSATSQILVSLRGQAPLSNSFILRYRSCFELMRVAGSIEFLSFTW